MSALSGLLFVSNLHVIYSNLSDNLSFFLFKKIPTMSFSAEFSSSFSDLWLIGNLLLLPSFLPLLLEWVFL